MDQTRFRALMHDVIGDEPMQPWLTTGVRARLAEPPPRRVSGAMAAVATILVAAVMVAGLVLPQLLAKGHAPITGPKVLPTAIPSVTPVVVDPSDCRLPVVVERGSGPPLQLAHEVGFIDTRTGRYTKDRSASRVGASNVPTYYSPSLQRWLLLSAGEVLAPDGRRYAWIRTLPAGTVYSRYKAAELHIYDLATASDQTIGTYRGDVGIWRWDSAGIHVSFGSLASSPTPAPTRWVLDPVSGAQTRDLISPVMPFPPFTPLAGDPHDPAFSTPGMTADGHFIWWINNMDRPGAVDCVFYETSPGHRVYLYRGIQGDATSFDPAEALVDSTGIWFSDANFAFANHAVIWHWRLGVGLRKFRVVGLPGKFNAPNAYVQTTPAGPCF